MSGLSLQLVIGIVLGLVVMAIGTTIMFGSSDNFSQGTSCVSEGGRCIDTDEYSCPDSQTIDASCSSGICCRIGAKEAET